MSRKLRGCDAALIFRDDGTYEGWLADYPPKGEEPRHLVLMGALLDRLKNDPAFAREILDRGQLQ